MASHYTHFRVSVPANKRHHAATPASELPVGTLDFEMLYIEGTGPLRCYLNGEPAEGKPFTRPIAALTHLGYFEGTLGLVCELHANATFIPDNGCPQKFEWDARDLETAVAVGIYDIIRGHREGGLPPKLNLYSTAMHLDGRLENAEFDTFDQLLSELAYQRSRAKMGDTDEVLTFVPPTITNKKYVTPK